MSRSPKQTLQLVIAFFACGILFANADANDSLKSAALGRNLPQLWRNGESWSMDAEDLDFLREEASAGSPQAEALWADMLLQYDWEDPDSFEAALAQADSLYSDAVGQGVPSAYLGLSKTILSGDVTDAERQEAVTLLLEASARGSAEADRLLADLMVDDSAAESFRSAWSLMVRAAEREDSMACLEVGDACMDGLWMGMDLSVDESVAESCWRDAAGQMSPYAAFRLAMYYSRDWAETTQANCTESVRWLYRAYLWAHESEPELITQMDQLGESVSIYPKVWVLARSMYEKTLKADQSENADETGEVAGSEDAGILDEDTGVKVFRNDDGNTIFQVKSWPGVYLTQTIEGASNGQPTLTLLGFSYDASYLWDGEVTMTENGSLAVDSEDSFWPSVRGLAEIGDTPFFVKILDGDYAGLIANVRSDWTPDKERTIVPDGNVSGVFHGQTHVALGRWRSLFSVFGAYNCVGLRPGTSSDDADQLILFDSGSQQVVRLFFNSELMAWVKADAPGAPVEDIILPPWQALFVLRRDESPLYLTVDGVISSTPVSLPVDSGLNLVGNVEGRFLPSTLSSGDVDEEAVMRADQVPIYRYDGKNESLVSCDSDARIQWWKLLGISASTPVHINGASAFILSETDRSVSYLLQR